MTGGRTVPGHASRRPGHLPLTAAQHAIWAAQQVDPANPIYNTGRYLDIRGPVDVGALAGAIAATAAEADVLRVRFTLDADEPRQIVLPPDDVVDDLVEIVDLRAAPDPVAAALDAIAADLGTPVDLLAGPLVTERVFVVGDERCLWYQRLHHILTDAYGFTMLVRRVTEHYTATVRGEAVPAARFASLAELVAEDGDYAGSARQQADREFWTAEFADGLEVTGLAPGTAMTSTTFLRREEHLDEALAARLRDLVAASGTTMAEVMTAAFALYLNLRTGRRDVVLGMPFMGRFGSVAMRVPSTTVNVVPLRLRVAPDSTVGDLIGHVSDRLRELRRHQRYRSEELRRDLRLLGAQRRLIGPWLNVKPFDTVERFADCSGETVGMAAGPVDDLALTVAVANGSDGVQLTFDANPELYSPAELEDHRRRFRWMLQQWASGPDTQLAVLTVLSPEERTEIVDRRGGTEAVLDQHETVVSLFTGQATASPDALALVTADQRLTYRELDADSTRLARLLADHGVRTGDLVAVALPRTASVVSALLAVLKLGAAYLPLDPDFPAARVEFMLADAAPVLLVCTADLAVHSDAVPRLCLDEPRTRARWDAASTAPLPAPAPHPWQPAYTIYTSGSTGRPKGVVVPGNALVNFLHAMRARFPLSEGDALLAVTTVGFDIFALEFYLPLISGATVVLADQATVRDPALLAAAMARPRVTVMQATPSLWRGLVEVAPETLAGLRALIGGEAVPEELATTLRTSGCQLSNVYGPTETTIWSITYPISGPGMPAVGTPIDNTRAYVLDAALRPVPDGTPGELYLAGAGVALGYHQRPGLTATRFVADPFDARSGIGARMYRTGDVARWDNRVLTVLGRTDHQLKVRGFRIEPGEIEAALERQDQVGQAVIVAREFGTGDTRLVAYLVADGGPDTVDIPELADRLGAVLPAYMVPATFVVVPEFPLTPNGKIDRQRLPAPGGASGPASRAPSSPAETALCELFAELLGVDEVGVDSDFFALGGHSLLAVRLSILLRERLGGALAVRDLFDAPTPAQAATRLGVHGGRPALERSTEPGPAPLSYGQRQLWFLHQLGGADPTYNIPLELRMRGRVDGAALRAALADLLARHEVLRAVVDDRDPDEPALRVLAAAEVDPGPRRHLVGSDDLDAAVSAAARHDFDLTVEPPLWTELFEVDGGRESVLLLVLHHIAGDEWSLRPLVDDLAAAYEARRQGRAPTQAALPVGYPDFARWQRVLIGPPGRPSALAERQLEFWSDALADLPEPALPTDRPRPSTPSAQGGTVEFTVDAELVAALRRVAGGADASLFMALHAGFAALLTKLGAGTDIVVGTPVAGRTDSALDDLVGFFVNSIVLRVDTSGDPTFGELLDRVRTSDLAAFDHQELPFELLVEKLNPARSLSRHPLFQVLFAYHAPLGGTGSFGPTSVRQRLVGTGTAKFDLTLNLTESRARDELAGVVEYRAELFDASSVERLVQRYLTLLRGVTEAPHRRLHETSVLTADESRRLLETVNDTARPIDTATVVEKFFATARATPDATALVLPDAVGQHEMSYRELAERTCRLAHLLRARGAGPGEVVAVALPRGASLVAAMLAAMATRAAYLPVDISLPAARIAAVCADARPRLVLTASSVADGVVRDPSALVGEIVDLDRPETIAELDRSPAPALPDGPGPADPPT